MRRALIACLALLSAAPMLVPLVRSADPPAAKPSDAPSDVAGDTIGTLAGAYLNQAYLSIGMLADAEASKVYEGEEAQDLLDVHLGLATMVEEQLQKLAKSDGLDKEDAATITTLVRIAGLIKAQGNVLHEIWSGKNEKTDQWEKLREITGDELDKFFGDDEPEKGK